MKRREVERICVFCGSRALLSLVERKIDFGIWWWEHWPSGSGFGLWDCVYWRGCHVLGYRPFCTHAAVAQYLKRDGLVPSSKFNWSRSKQKLNLSPPSSAVVCIGRCSSEVKKHIKQGQGHEGGIFTVEAPLHASNVQVIDPVTGKPCKVGTKYLEDGTKVRVSRGLGASGSIIPRPEILKMRTTPRPTVVDVALKSSTLSEPKYALTI
ncbi:Ribosomal protein [Parasponia andersonii]|uniref:Ribosomal protein n=1 Tax=Parasponia andersonii TaxID=3476 RepID=A0A2P5DLP6_PARAD|nr:Ribosomal protein [Parasponia andersonii]